MRGIHAALALIGVAAFLVVAGAGTAKEPAGKPLFGFVPTGQDSWSLARLDPLTVTPRRGRTMKLRDAIFAWSLAPDAAKLVVATGSETQSELRLVDTVRMRGIGRIVFSGQVQITNTFWPDERRLYAVVTHVSRRPDGNFDRQPASLVTIDQATRQVLAERSLDGYVHGSARAPSALGLILGPESGIGPARLAVVGADGRVTTIPLEGVTVGAEPFDESDHSAVRHYREAGLVLSPDAAHAYVASPGQLAAIDLRTLSVSYHRLGPARRLQKGPMEGSSRSVQWVRDRVLLVTGADVRPATGSSEELPMEIHAAPAQLVDTRDWSVRALDSTATYASVGSNAIALMGSSWSDKLQRNVGCGVMLYGLDGAKRAHLFGTTDTYGFALGRRAFIARNGYSYAVVSTTNGRVVRKILRLLPTPLLPQFQ
jgi:hypothetical protein